MSQLIRVRHHSTDAIRHLLPRPGTIFLFSHSLFTCLRRISIRVLRQRSPVSGVRQHGHPGFPLFLRPPGVRSISTRPRSCKAAGPCLLGLCEVFGSHKRRRHPERCRLASFPGTRSNPCPFDLGARSRAASARESAAGYKQETCQPSVNPWHAVGGVTIAPRFVTFCVLRAV